jgi:hypothetical protein
MNLISRKTGQAQTSIHQLNFWNVEFFMNNLFPIIVHLLPIVALFLLTSCDDYICVRGHGKTETQTFEVGQFEGIDVGGAVDVEIIKSADYKFEIEAQPNIIDQFRYRLKNKTLYIKSDCYNTSANPKIRIYCDNLSQVYFSGSGNIYSHDEFTSEDMNIDLSGSGKVMLRGKANNLLINISGSGRMELGDLNAKNCKIDISGSGKCYVDVDEKLEVRISGSGTVYYTGNPLVSEKISGSGSVRSNN